VEREAEKIEKKTLIYRERCSSPTVEAIKEYYRDKGGRELKIRNRKK